MVRIQILFLRVAWKDFVSTAVKKQDWGEDFRHLLHFRQVSCWRCGADGFPEWTQHQRLSGKCYTSLVRSSGDSGKKSSRERDANSKLADHRVHADISARQLELVALTRLDPVILYRCCNHSFSSDSDLGFHWKRLNENLPESIKQYNNDSLCLQ